MKLFSRNKKENKLDNDKEKEKYCLSLGHFYCNQPNPPKGVTVYTFHPEEVGYGVHFDNIILAIEIELLANLNTITYIENCDFNLPNTGDFIYYINENNDVINIGYGANKELLLSSFDTTNINRHIVYGYRKINSKLNDFQESFQYFNNNDYDVCVEVYGEHDYAQIYVRDGFISDNELEYIIADYCANIHNLQIIKK